MSDYIHPSEIRHRLRQLGFELGRMRGDQLTLVSDFQADNAIYLALVGGPAYESAVEKASKS